MLTSVLAAAAMDGQAFLTTPGRLYANEPLACQWSIATADCTYRVLDHRRVDPSDAREGGEGDVEPPEQLVVHAGHGTYIYAVHKIAPALVADELAIRVRLRADRPNLQLLARVVLPRSKDPATGRPFTLLLPGPMYHHRDTAQVLSLENIPTQLEQRVRVLRSQVDTPIDAREAMVDLIVLNVYGGQGTTTACIETVVVDRLLAADDESQHAVVRASAHIPLTRRTRSNTTVVDTKHDLNVTLDGDVLNAQGRPIFVRLIDHSGEPLEFLAGLGFNAIRLASTATHEQLQTADRLGLWIVCPPPDHDTPLQQHIEFGRVLAWDVGYALGLKDYTPTVDMVTAIRETQLLADRPVMGAPDAQLQKYGRYLDILVHHRNVLGTSFPLSEYADWLQQRRQLVHPGKCHWASIQTELPIELQRQTALFAGDRPLADAAQESTPAEPEQMRRLAIQAIGQGMRGLHFRSRSRLDTGTASAQQRAESLQLLNLELEHLAPWAAGGRIDENSSEGSRDSVRVATLRTHRSNLVIVSRYGELDQLVSSAASGTPLQVLIPGLPAATPIFRLTATGPQPHPFQRTAGGLLVDLEPYRNDTLFVLTDEPAILEKLSRDLSQRLPRVVSLSQRVLAREIGRTEEVLSDIEAGRKVPDASKQSIALACGFLRESVTHVQNGDFATAEPLIRQAASQTAVCRKALWNMATDTLPQRTASPLDYQFESLPRHLSMVHLLSRAHSATNVLPGGDFESLKTLLAEGWQCREYATPGVATQVALDSTDAHEGETCLRLTARRGERRIADTALESPPIWVNSPPIDVAPGQLIMIHGWANVPEKIQWNLDGLMIFDSLGGPGLGVRMRQTNGWQEFQLFRQADRHTTMTVTFALPGLGEALLDQITIRTLPLPGSFAERPEQVTRK